MQFNSLHPTDITRDIATAIDKYCEKIYNEETRRTHLGASEIGHECARYLWYKFRWAKQEFVSGRNGRLFNRGHREEIRFAEYMRGIGFELVGTDPATGNQARVSDINGHFGGSLDQIWQHPQLGVGLCEFKTSKTGSKDFSSLAEKGVRIAKQQHWAQMCTYGYKRGFTHAIYLCINKNDDDLYVEFVELDHKLGLLMVQRAGDIINSAVPPERCSSSPAYWLCKSCTMHGICWQQEIPEKNCRSCISAVPVADAQWHCTHYNQIIPPDFIPQGCDSWKRIA